MKVEASEIPAILGMDALYFNSLDKKKPLPLPVADAKVKVVPNIPKSDIWKNMKMAFNLYASLLCEESPLQ